MELERLFNLRPKYNASSCDNNNYQKTYHKTRSLKLH